MTSRIYTDFRRIVATAKWACGCGCVPAGADFDMARNCIKDMADEIDRLRSLIKNLVIEAKCDA